ncbi:SDR family oxidoreductase [Paenibacillus glycinis]|uniref:SDR family oxidoreductase n=1 Tax=Paenibacillus glycinis TaxID=2697035 RepID=A0ABW9XQG7_9BACL|nr:SDR family oxidoreductase [Paenibacillus glycinis]NBD24885.1 SDR family oxidoreductase [Paenibacillus glycinis]
MNLHGKAAIVTGGARGIGSATSKLLARRGTKVVVNYVSNRDAAQATVDAIRADGGEAIPVRADIRDANQVAELIRQTTEAFGGRIDIVVNNANLPFVTKPFVETTWEEFAQKLNDELQAAFVMTQAVIPFMTEQRYRRIVYVSSGAGKHIAPNMIAHGTAKGGLDTFANYIASEFGPFGITSNVVAPGVVETDATAFMPEETKQAISNFTPLRRMARPEDVARVISFLASDDSQFATGTYTPVNGGSYME